MRLIRALNRPALACATKRAICGIKHALVPCVLAALSVCIVPKSSGAEELSSKDRAPVETEVQCALAISPDYRLTIERWAPAGECTRPVRTRVTDRFLAFAAACGDGLEATRRCYNRAPAESLADAPSATIGDSRVLRRCSDIGEVHIAPMKNNNNGPYGGGVTCLRSWVRRQRVLLQAPSRRVGDLGRNHGRKAVFKPRFRLKGPPSTTLSSTRRTPSVPSTSARRALCWSGVSTNPQRSTPSFTATVT